MNMMMKTKNWKIKSNNTYIEVISISNKEMQLLLSNLQTQLTITTTARRCAGWSKDILMLPEVIMKNIIIQTSQDKEEVVLSQNISKSIKSVNTNKWQ